MKKYFILSQRYMVAKDYKSNYMIKTLRRSAAACPAKTGEKSF